MKPEQRKALHFSPEHEIFRLRQPRRHEPAGCGDGSLGRIICYVGLLWCFGLSSYPCPQPGRCTWHLSSPSNAPSALVCCDGDRFFNNLRSVAVEDSHRCPVVDHDLGNTLPLSCRRLTQPNVPLPGGDHLPGPGQCRAKVLRGQGDVDVDLDQVAPLHSANRCVGGRQGI